jgi:hypothetical protein
MKKLEGMSRALAVMMLLGAVGSHGQVTRPGALPEPPALPWKEINASLQLPGALTQLDDKGVKFTLFVPKGWSAPANGDVPLTAHFHGAHWFTIQEHTARGMKGPLLNFDLGLASEAYRVPFEDEKRFGRILRAVEKELGKRGSNDVRISTVDISSFSAGYGAVRQLIQTPEYFALIRRIVLLDSIYARYKAGPRGRVVREPDPEHIEPWVPFARAAINGQKTFLVTYSEVPTPSYASSSETTSALLNVLGVPVQPVSPGSTPASSDPDYPLRRRADLGRLHAWGYAGTDQKAHLAHARHLGEFWQSLDRVQQ